MPIKNGFPMPTAKKSGFSILNLHPKNMYFIKKKFNANLLENFQMF